MVVVLKKNVSEAQKQEVKSFLLDKHFRLNEIVGEEDTVFAAVGKVSMDPEELSIFPAVQKVIPISKPYKLASREFKREDTVVEIPNGRGQKIRVGGARIVAIAGPGMVESREQIIEVAKAVAASGAVMLRGGVYKPHLSPYSFAGLGEEGLRYLKEAGEAYGLPVVTEIVSPELIPMMKDYVDVFQIGARNMQDFNLLKKVGAVGKPVILKRSHTATLEELLMSAEYLLSSGTEDVILCERGIRTFETQTRNTLDLSSVPVLRSLTHLPVIVDPSKGVGVREKVPALGLASIACGADGIMVEVHTNPEKALSGGVESILPEQFDKLMHDVEALAPVMAKSLCHIRNESESVVRAEGCPSEKPVCLYSGKKGAYAEQAVGRYFDAENVEAVSVDSFDAVFQGVIDGKADYGMIPIENSLAGSVYQNYDNFTRFQDVSIVGGLMLNIRHSLLACKGASLSTIKNVYSHPQALAQSKKFLDAQNGWNQIEAVNTATAAKFVSDSASLENAAVGSLMNAKLYGLEVLAQDIEDDPGNFTRFVVIQANHVARKNMDVQNLRPNVASFIFTTKNEPGALYNVMGLFARNGLNLSRMESRPIRGQPWRYWFYVDADLSNNKGDRQSVVQYVESIVEQMKEKTEDVRLLGIYAEAKQ